MVVFSDRQYIPQAEMFQLGHRLIDLALKRSRSCDERKILGYLSVSMLVQERHTREKAWSHYWITLLPIYQLLIIVEINSRFKLSLLRLFGFQAPFLSLHLQSHGRVF